MNKILVYSAVFLLIFLSVQNIVLNHKVSNLESEKAILDSNLKSQIKLSKNTLTVKYRDKIVSGNVITKIVYVPKESSLVVDYDKEDNVNVKFNLFGFTLTPGLGVNYNGNLTPALNLRVFYFSRFGFGAYASGYDVGFYIDRRLDDLSFFDNTSIGLGYGKDINLKLNLFF